MVFSKHHVKEVMVLVLIFSTAYLVSGILTSLLEHIHISQVWQDLANSVSRVSVKMQ